MKPSKVKISNDNETNKKMKAEFFDSKGKKIKTVRFGAKGYSDFLTNNNDEEKKKRYLNRHRKNEDWNDPMTAGTLAKDILWNKPTLKQSIEDYKKKFNLD